MRALRLGGLVGVMLLSACSLQPQAPLPSAPVTKNHAHFAPPPEGQSHWDQQLGVYVLENTPGLYYRERTYYRWQHGWSWATQVAGPWQGCASSAVPAGLSRHYAQ